MFFFFFLTAFLETKKNILYFPENSPLNGMILWGGGSYASLDLCLKNSCFVRKVCLFSTDMEFLDSLLEASDGGCTKCNIFSQPKAPSSYYHWRLKVFCSLNNILELCVQKWTMSGVALVTEVIKN